METSRTAAVGTEHGLGGGGAPLPLYAEAFGFLARPFALAPDAGSIYWSGAHRRAQSVLEYALVSAAPAVLLTGEIGTGKTVLIHELIARLGPEVRVAFLANGRAGRQPVAAWVLAALGLEPAAAGPVALHRQLQEAALEEHAAGRRLVVIVDEAQNLGAAALEELRLLTNLNTGREAFVQLVLVGQPELREVLGQVQLRQLAQRIVAATHLGAMDAETVAAYVAHRLRAAGGTGAEVTPAAARLVHAATGGIARLVNQLCDFALLYAWSQERLEVDEALVDLVLREGVFFAGAPAVTDRGPETGPRVAHLREAIG